MPDGKMHADELPIDEPLVRRLLAEQFPEWSRLPLRRIEPGGTVHVIFRLGDELSVRLPRREGPTAPGGDELEWLPRLAPLLPVEIPVPVAQGRPSDEYPWFWEIHSWLEGETVPVEELDAMRAAGDLAALVAALQRVDPAGAPPGRGIPLCERDSAVRYWLARFDRADEVTPEWERALAAPPWDGPPVWHHGDLDVRNWLVRDGRISGVIDWGEMGVGDPACDVMVAWKLHSAAARDAFREALPTDDATWERARGWVLSQAVAALAYYTPENNPSLYREAESWLELALAESPRPTKRSILDRLKRLTSVQVCPPPSGVPQPAQSSRPRCRMTGRYPRRPSVAPPRRFVGGVCRRSRLFVRTRTPSPGSALTGCCRPPNLVLAEAPQRFHVGGRTMSFRYARALGAAGVVTLSLVLAQFALAETPISRFTAADQAAAKAVVLKAGDLPPGMKGGLEKNAKPSTGTDCPGLLEPKQSDLVITGVARSEFAGRGAHFSSTVQIYETARMAVLDWERTVVHPGVLPCARKLLAAEATPEFKVVSFKRVPFPRVGRAAVRFRLIADVREKAGAKPVRILIDDVAFGRGRTGVQLSLTARYSDRREADFLEAGLAGVMLRRARV